jgi:hypothetical protein
LRCPGNVPWTGVDRYDLAKSDMRSKASATRG